jgi:multicomponent K+:H+ antiporter subunit D
MKTKILLAFGMLCLLLCGAVLAQVGVSTQPAWRSLFQHGIDTRQAGKLQESVDTLAAARSSAVNEANRMEANAELGASLLQARRLAEAAALCHDLDDKKYGGSDALQAQALQGHWTPLGVGFFILAVAAAGVPPLAGFFGKALLLQAAGQTPMAVWVVTVVLASSLAMMVALARAGSVLFWKPGARSVLPQAPALPGFGAGAARPAPGVAATVALLLAIVGCAVFAGPVARYTQATAEQLLDRRDYLQAVLGARPVPPAHDVRQEMRARGDAK